MEVYKMDIGVHWKHILGIALPGLSLVEITI